MVTLKSFSKMEIIRVWSEVISLLSTEMRHFHKHFQGDFNEGGAH